MKFFRILVALLGLSTTFWHIARFINQSLVFVFQAPAGYICSKDPSFKFCSEYYIKWTLFLSSKTFCIVSMIFYCLLAIKKKEVLEFIAFLVFCKDVILGGRIFHIWDASVSKYLKSLLSKVIWQVMFIYLN